MTQYEQSIKSDKLISDLLLSSCDTVYSTLSLNDFESIAVFDIIYIFNELQQIKSYMQQLAIDNYSYLLLSFNINSDNFINITVSK